MDSEHGAKKPTFYFGWLVVLVGFMVTAIRAGIGMQTLGFIVRPMETEMGWRSSAITLCITLQLVVAAAIGPWVGRLLDSVGAKKILTSGLAANGVMLILVSFVQELWQLAAVMILFGGVTQACIGNTLIMPLITKWFKRRRGFAMGLVSTGANLGSVIIAPLIVGLMGENADWRYAWFVIGLIPIVVVAPAAYLILNRGDGRKPSFADEPAGREERMVPAAGRRKSTAKAVPASPAVASAVTASTAASPATAPAELSFTVREAMGTSAFWKVIVAWNLVDFSMKGALLNKIPYALEMNYTAADGAGILAVYGVLAIVGKLLIGWMSDRMPLHVIGIALAALQAAGLYMFIDAPTIFSLYLAYGILSGLSAGGLITLMPIMLADYYGSKFQGALSGVTISLLLFSSVGGPLSASVIRDATGSYGSGFMLYVALTLAAAILFAFIRKPKPIIL